MIKKLLFVVVLMWGALGYAIWELPDGLMHVRFLDVGQGDAILVETPEGHDILVDGGPGAAIIEQLNEVLPFFDKRLDMLVLTHPDMDHVAGLVEVLRRYKVDNVLMTGAVLDSSFYEAFLAELDEENVLIAESGVDFEFGDVLLDVIYPLDSVAGREFVKINESSVGIRIVYGEEVILLTGDLGETSEAELLRTGVDLKANILKVGHHGSKYSSSAPFLAKVRPEAVVIQVGENSYGHPSAEALTRFTLAGVRKIWRTDLDGSVEFVF